MDQKIYSSVAARVTVFLSALLFIFSSLTMFAQNIASGEGVNFVGQINGYAQPTNLAADYRVLTYRRVSTPSGTPTDGRGQWTTTVNVQSSGGNVTPSNMPGGGGNGFLFTSGPGGNQYQNKWVFTGVGQGALNSVNAATYQGSTDMGLNMGTTGYYTFVMQDNGYNSNSYFVGYTSTAPVTVTHTAASQQYLMYDGTLRVTATTSATPSAQENVYVRYRVGTNDFTTGTSLVQASGSGTTWNAFIPSASNSTVYYYVFTSTRSLAQLNGDAEFNRSMATVRYADNNGSNYNYTFPNFTTNPVIVNSTGGTLSAVYPTLTVTATGAFVAINAGTHTGTISIGIMTSISTETGAISLNASGAGSASYTSILLVPNATVTLSGNVALPLIYYNGADNVTIDGRIGATGTTKSLTISNLSTSGQTIQLASDASSNTIKYCNILGVNTSNTSGTILIGAGTITGNDTNTIDNCDIRDGASTPANAIYSSNGVNVNDNCTVSNCNIYNFYSSSGSTAGILLSTGSSGWSITGNSFYQTASRTGVGSSSFLRPISINAGSGYTVTGNFIGGTAPSCGSTALTINGTAASYRFTGINVTQTTSTSSTIQNNTIANIVWLTTSGATTAPGVFAGIYCSGSGTNSSITGNTIGATTGTGNISVTVGTSGGVTYGIITNTGSTAVMTVSNNNIGSITSIGSSASISTPIRCIEVQAGATVTISGNTIGSTSTANSINASTASTNGTVQDVSGIVCGATGTVSITGNTIANLTNAYVLGSSSASVMLGISSTAATSNTITGNTIRNFSTGAAATAPTSTAGMIGILVLGTSTGNTISQNTIHTFANSNTTAAVTAIGIHYAGGTSGTNVMARNNIHSFSMVSTSASADLRGININSGLLSIQNNMIRLGIDATGASLTTGINIFGINELVIAANTEISHNSVYIGGSGVGTQTGNTYAFYSAVTFNARSFRNNIFVNARSNASTGGTHFGIREAGTGVNPTGLNSNYNDIFVTGTGGVFGQYNAVSQASISAWQTATGQDLQSLSANPVFLLPTGTSATVDLHLNSAGTPCEQAGTNIAAISDDFDGQTRSTLTPTDIGADAGNYTAIDLSAPAISYTAVTSPTCNTGNITVAATITDATGVPLTGSLVPRLYYKINAGSYTSVAGNNTGGTTTNSTWDFVIPGSAVGNTISYYIIAQDAVGAPNIGSVPAGVVASNVNTVSTHPSSPNTYTINPTLNGNYNVGSGQTYTTITAAIAAYNGACLSGAVTFTLTDAAYNTGETFPITINANANASATNTLTIKASVASTVISGSASTAIFLLNGCDYVTIDGSISATANTVCPLVAASRDLTITNTNTGTASAVVWLQTAATGTDAATNNTVRNCNLTGSGVTQTLFGVGSGSQTISTSSFGTLNVNNSFINNNISGVQYGIYSQGASAGSKNTGTVINQNTINTSANTKGGIWVGFESGIVISGNTISNIAQSTSPDVFAISCGFGATMAATTSSGNEVVGATITNNTIGSVVNSGAFSAFGIGVSAATSGTTLIANNMIYGVIANGTGGDFSGGIVLGGGAGSATNVYYNTVSMQGTITGASSASQTSACLAVTNSTPATIDIRNNIFQNTQVGNTGATTVRFVSIALAQSTFAGLTCNYNDLYVAGAGPGVYHVGLTAGVVGTARTTLVNWQGATGTDANSINTLTTFVSTTNLHSTGAAVNNTGTPVTVTTDFDCATRSGSTPDIGADEFTIASDDAGVTALSTGNPCPGSSTSVTATIFNYGSATLTTVDVIWSVNGGSNTTQSFTGLGIAGGASGTVTITGVIFGNSVSAQTMTASTNIPNGGSDANTANDSFTNSAVNTALTGTYTVGAAGTFTSIPNALARAASYGICGPTIFSLIDASYTAASTITIGQYTGVSATNTLTIKPATGVTTAITGAASISPIITFDGADYVILDGSNGATANTVCPASAASRDLTITSNSTSTSGTVVWIQTGTGTNSATNNKVMNCNIVGNSNTTTLFAIGNASPSVSITSAGTSNNNNSIINNNIQKAQYGIYSVGLSTGTKNQGNIINQNLINSSSPNNIAAGGIWVGFENNITISGNTISEIAKGGDVFGITAGMGGSFTLATAVDKEVTNATITNNIIGNVNSSLTNSALGIALGAATSGTSTIANNFVYGVNGNPTPADYISGIAVGGGTGSTTNIYHNTVLMQGTHPIGTASSSVSACLAVTAASAPILDIRNNIFTNTQLGNASSTARFTCIALGYSSTVGNYTNLVSNNNDLYSAGAGPGTYVTGITGGVTGTSRTTLANWQAETGRDGASMVQLPAFTSTSDLHLVASSSSNLPFEASAVAALISNDIDCAARNATTPDLGADEFVSTVPANDAGITAIVMANPVCPGTVMVQATIKNYGSAPITSVLIDWSVNAVAQSQVNPSVNIPVNGTATVNLGNYNFVSSVSAYTVVAYTTLPNGATDANGTNDSFTNNAINTFLTGTYTVGATGADFATLTAAVTRANAVGLCGPTVFSLIDASYTTSETFPITINALTGSSATNTLTIKPTGATSISGSSASALIFLKDADYVTIDGSTGSTVNTVCPLVQASRDLTISNTNSSSSSAVIWLQQNTAGATNNVIKNCNVQGNGPSTTLACIGSGGTTITVGSTGLDNDNNQYINNSLSKAQYGIFSQGASTSNYNLGTVASLNSLNTASPNQIGRTGIYVGYENGAVIQKNTIANISGNTTDAFGISLGLTTVSVSNASGNENINSLVDANTITGISSTLSSAIGIGICTTTTAGANTISNNMITGIASPVASPDYGSGILVGGGSTGSSKVYNNTVYMTGTVTDTGARNYCISVNGTNPIVDLRNNLLVNLISSTATSSGAPNGTTCIGLAYSGSYTNFTSNNNAFYVVSGGNVGSAGGLVNGTPQPTLAGWQSAIGGTTDNASISGTSPVFISSTDLHIDTSNANNYAFNGTASNIASIANDIDCDTRTNPYDIGADEFAVPNCSAAVGGTVTATTPVICGTSGSTTVTAIGYSPLYVGISYQWEYSLNGLTGWTTLSGQTNPASMSTGTISVTTYYRLAVTCSFGSITNYSSNVASVIIGAIPTASASSNSPVCLGGTIVLTGTTNIGSSFSWTGPNGFTSPSQNPQIFSSTAAAAGIYSFVATSSVGCPSATATTVVAITPLPTAPTTGAYAICQGATVPGGSGLTASGSTSPTYTYTGLFTGTLQSESTTATIVSTLVVPALPTGAVITSAQLQLFNVVAISPSWRSEIRASLSGAYTLADTQLSILNSSGTISPDPAITLTSFPTAGGTINLLFRETTNDATPNPDATIASAQIVITYTLPITYAWFTASTGGSSVATGSPYDPVGGGQVNNATTGNTTFYVEAQTAAGCPSSRSTAVFTVRVLPTASLTGSTTICNGGSTTVPVVVTGTGTISGTLSPGAIPFSGTAGTINVSVSPTSGVTYTVATLSDANCTAVAGGLTGSYVVNVNARPTASVSGTSSVCNGSSTTVAVTVTGSGTISGTLNPGSIPFSGTAPTINVNVSPTIATVYSVATLSDANCTAIAGDLSGTATVNINARPTASVSGSTTICNGSSTTIAITVSGSGTISGTLNPGAIAFSGTAPTINVSVSPTGNTTYSVATLSDANCSAIAADLTGTRVVNVNARPTASLTGTSAICNGSSGTVVITVTGSGTISGTLNPGSIAFSGTAPTINVSVSPTGNTTYSVASLSDANCTSIAADLTGSQTINVNARPTASVSGSTTICYGSSTSIAIAVTGSGTISGTLNPGAIPFSGTAPTINVSVSPLLGTVYAVASLSDANCTSIAGDLTGTYTVNVNPGPTGVISGTQTICSTTTATVSIAVTGTGPYSGTLNPGAIAFSGAGPTINVVVSPSISTTYTIATLNDASCPAQSLNLTGSAIVTVTPASTWYLDLDGDGYSPGTTILACVQPANYYLIGQLISVAGDCNDSNGDVNPGADEWCNGIDDDCDGLIDEGLPLAIYYRDLDNDGYGNPLVTQTTCSQPTGYVINNTDCNDNNATVYPGAVEIADALDNDCDGTIDEGFGPINDFKETALILYPSNLGVCNAYNGTLAGASASPPAQVNSTVITGEDAWHYITPQYTALRIVVTTTANNLLLELQNSAGALVATENVQAGLGTEIMNVTGLTPGATYYLVVRNYNSAQGIGAYSICVQNVLASGCDYGAGPYTLCSTYKATYRGVGVSYRFDFTETTSPFQTFTRTQASDILVLSNVPNLQYGYTYNASITAIYTLTDGSGANETIEVPQNTPCTMIVSAEPQTSLRASDRCVNGTRFRGSIVASLPWVCGVTNWAWEFQELDGSLLPVGLPIQILRGAANNLIGLGTIPQLQYGKTYAVRTAPIFSYTSTPLLSNVSWGPAQNMCILGSALPILSQGGGLEDLTERSFSMDGTMSLAIYPNPNNGQQMNINLTGLVSEMTRLSIKDEMGREVWFSSIASEGSINRVIDFDKPLASGIYMISAVNGETMITRRLIVTK